MADYNVSTWCCTYTIVWHLGFLIGVLEWRGTLQLISICQTLASRISYIIEFRSEFEVILNSLGNRKERTFRDENSVPYLDSVRSVVYSLSHFAKEAVTILLYQKLSGFDKTRDSWKSRGWVDKVADFKLYDSDIWYSGPPFGRTHFDQITLICWLAPFLSLIVFRTGSKPMKTGKVR